MKLPENDIPKTIFFYLFFEYFCLSNTNSEPVAIFCNKLFSIIFSDPVTNIVSKHSPENGEKNREKHMLFSPKSPHQNHDIHPRNGRSDDRKGFDTGREKCNKIVPISNHLNKFSYPLDCISNPVRFHKRDDDNHKCKNRKKYGKKFREECECFFNHEREVEKILKKKYRKISNPRKDSKF